MVKRKGKKGRRKASKPSLLVCASLAYKAYDAWNASKDAVYKTDAFIKKFTGIKNIGKYAEKDGQMEFFIQENGPVIGSIVASRVLNKLPETKGLPGRVPVMKKFKW